MERQRREGHDHVKRERGETDREMGRDERKEEEKRMREREWAICLLSLIVS